MFYVSKRINRNKFEVTDSETGKAEVTLYRDIQKAFDLGIKIEGVSKDSVSDRISIVPVSMLQKSVQQMKMLMIKGVRLEIENDVLLSLSLIDELHEDIILRLSDYCKCLGDYFINYNAVDSHTNGYHITLVLDNGIKISKNAFNLITNNKSLLLKIKDCDKSVSNFYKSALNVSYNINDFGALVSDDNVIRFNRFLCECVLVFGPSSFCKDGYYDYVKAYFLENYQDLYKLSDDIYNRHKKKFFNILTKFGHGNDVFINDYISMHNRYKDNEFYISSIVNDMRCIDLSYQIVVNEPENEISADFCNLSLQVCRALRSRNYYSDFNFLLNYLWFFKCNPDIMDLFIEFKKNFLLEVDKVLRVARR